MPATSHQVERLNLTFLAEPAAQPRSLLPGGWWIWCLIGIGVGLGGWLASREYLAGILSKQLVSAKSSPEAILAIEGLMLLDPTASKEIVAGLQNEDFAVARTAFRAIESQLTRWQQFKPTEAKNKMQALAQSLLDLPDTTPTENRILASSLASRMFTMCLEREDQSLKPLMELCEQVIERVGRGKADEAVSLIAEADTAVANDLETDLPPGSGPNSQSSEIPELSSDPLSLPPPSLESMAPQSPRNQLPVNQEGGNAASESGQQAAMRIEANESPRTGSPFIPSISSSGARAEMRLVTGPGQAVSLRSSRNSSPNIAHIPEHDAEPTATETPLEFATSATEPSEADEDEALSAKTLAGIEQLPIQELVRLLGSVQPKIAQAATLTLRRKGMSDGKLELAMELATGTEVRRLAIIDEFPQRTDIDPRVWLLWMAQDGQAQVRGRAIAQLSSMLDQDVMRELRMLLNRERDPQVAQLIRRVLISP